MEFEFKKNIKIVVDFEIGEKVLIEGGGYKMDGKRIIEKMYTHFGGCESGIMAYVSGYDSPIDIGWLTKIKLVSNTKYSVPVTEIVW